MNMNKKYIFKKSQWDPMELCYAYSPACFDRVVFRQEEDCIVNSQGKSLFGYEYISLIEPFQRKVGAQVTAQCSFEKFGAPLVVLTDDIRINEKGERIYGKHFEVVAYEEGINIWRVEPWPERIERPIKSTLLAEKKFVIQDNSLIEIKTEILSKKLRVWVNGEYLEVEIPDLPTESFWTGITACEGINRFYSLEIEE